MRAINGQELTRIMLHSIHITAVFDGRLITAVKYNDSLLCRRLVRSCFIVGDSFRFTVGYDDLMGQEGNSACFTGYISMQ